MILSASATPASTASFSTAAFPACDIQEAPFASSNTSDKPPTLHASTCPRSRTATMIGLRTSPATKDSTSSNRPPPPPDSARRRLEPRRHPRGGRFWADRAAPLFQWPRAPARLSPPPLHDADGVLPEPDLSPTRCPGPSLQSAHGSQSRHRPSG